MTMAEAEDILGFWAENPPPYVLLGRIDAMIAAWLGVKRSRAPAASTAAANDAAGAPSSIGDYLKTGGFAVGPPIKMPLPEAEMFDIDALRRQARERRAARR